MAAADDDWETAVDALSVGSSGGGALSRATSQPTALNTSKDTMPEGST